MTLRFDIAVRSPADEVLYEGLPRLEPVLAALGEGALLIGGLATAAWLSAKPVGLAIRATRDVDLGIDRVALGITRERTPVRPLLDGQDFAQGFGGEDFRFSWETAKGPFIVDLLVAAVRRARRHRSWSPASQALLRPAWRMPSPADRLRSNWCCTVRGNGRSGFTRSSSMLPLS